MNIEEQKTTIVENRKYFNFYKKLPKIMLISSLILFFIWGIVDAAVFKIPHYSYFSYEKTYTYGIMQVSSGFLAWLIWQIIGLVVAFSTYFLTKFSQSVTILKVEYLAIIANAKMEEHKDETQKETPAPIESNKVE